MSRGHRVPPCFDHTQEYQLFLEHPLLLLCGEAFYTCPPHTLGGRDNAFPFLLMKIPKCRKVTEFARSYTASGHWSPDAETAGYLQVPPLYLGAGHQIPHSSLGWQRELLICAPPGSWQDFQLV